MYLHAIMIFQMPQRRHVVYIFFQYINLMRCLTANPNPHTTRARSLIICGQGRRDKFGNLRQKQKICGKYVWKFVSLEICFGSPPAAGNLLQTASGGLEI